MKIENRGQSRVSSRPLNLRFSLMGWLGAEENAGGNQRVPALALRQVEKAGGEK